MLTGVKRSREGLFIGFDFASIKPDEVSVLDSFEAILGDIQKHDPTIAERLTLLKRFLVELRGAYHDRSSIPRSSVPATSFESVQAAANAVEVIYFRNSTEHMWRLRKSDGLSDGVLSPWGGEVF
jgi:hypothetical protein